MKHKKEAVKKGTMSKISDPSPLDLGHSPQFFLASYLRGKKAKLKNFRKWESMAKCIKLDKMTENQT